MSHFTIAIAGGGLLGRLSAWRLLKAGHRVHLYEAGSLKHCRGAAITAAGMISPLAELVDSDAYIYEMGMHSLTLWQQWLSECSLGTAATSRSYSQSARKLLHQNGSIIVAHPQDHTELDQFNRNLCYHRSPTSEYQVLSQQALHKLEPALQQFQKGLFLKKEAHIDNQQLLPLLLNQIIQLGGTYSEHCKVNTVTANYMDTSQGRVSADWHIDCRGIGAKPSLEGLRGVRGEVLWISTDEVKLSRPVRLLHPRYKLYIVPKPNRQFIIGATEIESEDLSPISLQSNLELSSALYSLNPAFAEARLIKSDVNLRPALMNNRPYLDCQPGYLCANGLYRHGYLLAPSLVDSMLAEIHQNPASRLSKKLLENSQAC